MNDKNERKKEKPPTYVVLINSVLMLDDSEFGRWTEMKILFHNLQINHAINAIHIHINSNQISEIQIWLVLNEILKEMKDRQLSTVCVSPLRWRTKTNTKIMLCEML